MVMKNILLLTGMVFIVIALVSRFVAFEKSGHLPFYEEPEKFNLSLVEFLKGTGIPER